MVLLTEEAAVVVPVRQEEQAKPAETVVSDCNLVLVVQLHTMRVAVPAALLAVSQEQADKAEAAMVQVILVLLIPELLIQAAVEAVQDILEETLAQVDRAL